MKPMGSSMLYDILLLFWFDWQKYPHKWHMQMSLLFANVSPKLVKRRNFCKKYYVWGNLLGSSSINGRWWKMTYGHWKMCWSVLYHLWIATILGKHHENWLFLVFLRQICALFFIFYCISPQNTLKPQFLNSLAAVTCVWNTEQKRSYSF